MTASDGKALLASFERLAAQACAASGSAIQVLEAAAMGIALAELGLLEGAADRDRVASCARKSLLAAATLREAAEDEDARDALDLALEQARRGASLLGGGPLSSLDGAPTHEPTPYELGRLLRGELDGHAAADVALRLHRSGMRERYAAFLPAGTLTAVARPGSAGRLAADSAPLVRDPTHGRAIGTERLEAASLEAFLFDDGAETRVIAIYAEPAIAISLVSSDTALAGRAVETSGYLEVTLVGPAERVTLELAGADRTLLWTLQVP